MSRSSALLHGEAADPGGTGSSAFVGRSPARRVRRMIYATFAVACLAVASGVIGAALIKSPAQVAADSAPPAPSVITAPVVRKVLSESVVIRGTFAVGGSLSFAPTSVASTVANAGGTALVVTGMFVGPVSTCIRARWWPRCPIVRFLFCRAICRSGAASCRASRGKDVAELQLALAELGYSSGDDSEGIFGAGTEAAVRAFYAGIGYAAPIEADDSTGAPSSGGTGATPSANPGSDKKAAVPPAIVPMSEAWFIPHLPAEVLAVSAHVGQSAPTSLLTMAEGTLRLTGQLDPSEQSLVKPGMRVSVYSNISGFTGAGKISSVGTHVRPSGPNSGAFLPISIAPRAKWPASLNGQNVQITITAVTTGHPVLAVPVAAVSYDASGHAEVIVRERGSERRISVRTGMSAGGYVEITGVDGARDALSPGMQMVVGH